MQALPTETNRTWPQPLPDGAAHWGRDGRRSRCRFCRNHPPKAAQSVGGALGATVQRPRPSRPSLPAPRQGHGSRSARLSDGGGGSGVRRIPACPLLSRVLLSGPFHLSRRQFHACEMLPALRMPCPCRAVPAGPWSAGFRGHPQGQTPQSRLPNPHGARGPQRDTALTTPRVCPTQILLPCGPRGLLCTRA